MYLPKDIIQDISSYSVNRISDDKQLYYEARRLNPNFSLQMEYYAHLVESRKERYESEQDILNIYRELQDVNYSMQYVEEDDKIEIYTDEGYMFGKIFGTNYDEVNQTLNAEYDSLAFRFYMHVRYNERGYIAKEALGGELYMFKLEVPEGYYHEEYSQDMINSIRDEGLSLFTIVEKQQRYYNMTRVLPDKIREYCDTNRRYIKHVSYDAISREINIMLLDGITYGFMGDIQLYKGIIAYIHHPGNIIHENRITEDNNIINRYYTLDTLDAM